MEVGDEDIATKFRCFTNNKRELCIPGQNLTSHLKMPFKAMADVVAKIMLSHFGNDIVLTDPKIRILSALVSELQGIEYNWSKFLVD